MKVKNGIWVKVSENGIPRSHMNGSHNVFMTFFNFSSDSSDDHVIDDRDQRQTGNHKQLLLMYFYMAQDESWNF